MAFFNYTGNPALAPDGRPWRDYVLDVLKAREAYQPGLPETQQGPLAPGSGDPLETLPWLYPLIGDIAPYLTTDGLAPEDQTRLHDFSGSAFYSATARDSWSPWGDQFFTALAGLGLATGAAGAYGGFAGAGAGAAAGGEGTATLVGGTGGDALLAASVPAAEIAPVAATPGLTAASAPTVGSGGVLSSLATYGPSVSAGGSGLTALGTAVGSPEVQQAGQGVRAVGSAAGFAGGGGTTSLYGGGSPDPLTTYGEVGPDGYITTDPQVLADLEQAQADIPASDSGGDFGGTLADLRKIYGVAGPLVSAAGSLYGGITGANAARNAATTQANAANQANALLSRIYDTSRNDLAPYRAVGTAALGQLAGLTDQPLTYGPFTPPTGQEALTQDPGYLWRLEQGQRALERSAASKGLTLSGGQLKDLSRFSQGLASQEYGNAYTRNLTNYTTNFSTLQSLRDRRYNELAGLAGTGQTSINATNQLAATTGAAQAGNITSAGAATAAGKVGASNAVNTGVSGVGNAFQNFQQYQLLSSLLDRQKGIYAA